MANKANKRAKALKESNAPVEKDDGTRWTVIGADGLPAYIPAGGTTKAQATRLAAGLVQQASIERVT